LAQLIAELQPDIVHTMEMQRCGYVTAEARRRIAPGDFPKWIYSSWGSDMYLYGRREEHLPRIQEVLGGCDYVITDCERDIGLARQMGFRGEVLGTVPVGGGFHLESIRRAMQPGPVSSRKTINIKGRHAVLVREHDYALGGRALVALDAVRRCARMLAEYEIVVHYASPAVQTEAMALARQTGLKISVLPNSPHEDILRLMGRSRIAIALGVSDGTPLTMLEAMIAGAFPIQSDTVSTREWIGSNNGLLVPPEDAEAVAAAIARAIEDDQLVNRAAELNAAIADERLERGKVREKVLDMYRRVMADGRNAGSLHSRRVELL
jgi:glycosyltransferase involved in cell wall biosynthesis